MLRFKPKKVPINTVILLFSIQADFSHRGLENSLDRLGAFFSIRMVVKY